MRRPPSDDDDLDPGQPQRYPNLGDNPDEGTVGGYTSFGQPVGLNPGQRVHAQRRQSWVWRHRTGVAFGLLFVLIVSLTAALVATVDPANRPWFIPSREAFGALAIGFISFLSLAWPWSIITWLTAAALIAVVFHIIVEDDSPFGLSLRSHTLVAVLGTLLGGYAMVYFGVTSPGWQLLIAVVVSVAFLVSTYFMSLDQERLVNTYAQIATRPITKAIGLLDRLIRFVMVGGIGLAVVLCLVTGLVIWVLLIISLAGHPMSFEFGLNGFRVRCC